MAVLLLGAPISAKAQDPAPPPTETPVTAPAAAVDHTPPPQDSLATQVIQQAPGATGQTNEDKKKETVGLLDPQSTPILYVLIVATVSLIAGVAAAIGSLIVTPRTTRENAVDQIQAMRDNASDTVTAMREGFTVADKSAEAAAESARAAGKNAEAAALNAQNTGVHAVARLRQDWINTLRAEIAELHATLMNFIVLPLGDRPTGYDEQVKKTNASLTRVRLLLNPSELASKKVLAVLDGLNQVRVSAERKTFLCRWLVRWSQVVLKTEWDRVRDEMHGRPVRKPYRRPLKRGVRR
jgi:hypothetical protein